jgi:hypothetical protein
MSKHLKQAVRTALVIAASFSANAVFADDAASWKQLSSEWWQWAVSIPAPVNPLVDTTGDNCMIGQRGSNWFLAGTVGGAPVTRSCEIPEGATLFFPVVNAINFDTPGQCGQGAPLPASFYRSLAAAFINGVTQLSITLDGPRSARRTAQYHRVRSRLCRRTTCSSRRAAAICPRASLPAVDDGFYARLDHLKVGKHTLHIHAEVPSAGFVVDVASRARRRSRRVAVGRRSRGIVVEPSAWRRST